MKTIFGCVLIAFLLISIVAIAGCTSTGESTSKDTKYVPVSDYCDREAEARIEATRARIYCENNPYGTYYGDVCGIGLRIVC